MLLIPKQQARRWHLGTYSGPGSRRDDVLVKELWIIIKKVQGSIVWPVFSLAPSFSNTFSCLVEDEDS